LIVYDHFIYGTFKREGCLFYTFVSFVVDEDDSWWNKPFTDLDLCILYFAINIYVLSLILSFIFYFNSYGRVNLVEFCW